MIAVAPTAKELPKVAQSIVATLNQHTPYVVWLSGEMGSGKTTLTGEILRSLGLDPTIDTPSPTFTFMNEYTINGFHYAHLDLYRADEKFRLEELGVLDAKDYRGIFIEWAAIGGCAGILDPDFTIEIKLDSDGARTISLLK